MIAIALAIAAAIGGREENSEHLDAFVQARRHSVANGAVGRIHVSFSREPSGYGFPVAESKSACRRDTIDLVRHKSRDLGRDDSLC